MVHGKSFSLSVSVKDERVGEGAMVGRRESSVEGVREGCGERVKSSICKKREKEFWKAMACLVSGGGIPLVGVAGEGGSSVSEKDEPRFLDEQVWMVSAGLREVEEARARLGGGVREEGEGSDMV